MSPDFDLILAAANDLHANGSVAEHVAAGCDIVSTTIGTRPRLSGDVLPGASVADTSPEALIEGDEICDMMRCGSDIDIHGSCVIDSS